MTDALTRWLQGDIGLVQMGKAESLLESRLEHYWAYLDGALLEHEDPVEGVLSF